MVRIVLSPHYFKGRCLFVLIHSIIVAARACKNSDYKRNIHNHWLHLIIIDYIEYIDYIWENFERFYKFSKVLLGPEKFRKMAFVWNGYVYRELTGFRSGCVYATYTFYCPLTDPVLLCTAGYIEGWTMNANFERQKSISNFECNQ